ncbi:MAG: hypothetical protein JWM33_2244, partial [Caulobacteraceae bacterium]|nr:hypothetical protein [Caulobacteraceae bacterium]
MTQGQSGGFDIAGFFRDPRVKTTLYWLAVVGIWGLILVVALVLVFARGLPNISRLDELKGEPTIAYLDRSGAQIAIRGEQKTDLVKLGNLPPYVPKAFIVTEDQWFYWHPGFNPWGIVRSQLYNMRHHGQGVPLRGGSTITQQVA